MRGGSRFYASAARYFIDHVDQIIAILRTASAKRANLH